MNNSQTYTKALISEAPKELARQYHLNFIEYCWNKPNKYKIGKHTRSICNKIDKAINDYRKGISTFLIIQVPFRHGKTEIISRNLPPHFLGEFPDNEIICATYAADLANDISRSARDILRSDKFKELYKIQLSGEMASVQNWSIDQHYGSTHWVGVGGPITGKGYNLGIVDDYLKNREDAESQVIRDKQWYWFTEVFLTRRAPVSITIILATPWHTDDIIGRIKAKNSRKSESYDKDFPKFKIVRYPAFEDSGKTLFPGRFDKKWYNQQKAALGTYGTASLLQCNPIIRGGNLLKVDKIKIIDEDPPFMANLRFCRGWDLASTEKELIKGDPDWTVGCLLAVYMVDGVQNLYIRDIKRIRAEAPERDRLIIQTAELDGLSVKIGIESVAGYKDTFARMSEALKGKAVVNQITVSRDKIIRASILEPIFEAGNVYLFRGNWNHKFIDEVSAFPSGQHDDQVDAMVCAYEMAKVNISVYEPIVIEHKPITAGLMNKTF